MMNPLVAPLGAAGLGWCLLGRGGKPFRTLGWAFLAVLGLMVSQRAKPYYLSPSYTLLFATGSVAVAGLACRWRSLQATLIGLLVLSGLALAPIAKPLLPVESYLRYATRLGIVPPPEERHQLGRLPQSFADRLGWEELAKTVSDVHRALPPEEQELACVFGQNYGQAGAIDFFGPRFGLPRALSGHNSYHLWGHGECTGEVMLVIGDDREDLLRIFDDVQRGADYHCADCMPYESEKTIWVCRRMRLPMAELWPRIRHFN
jgi:hypothetical protein